MATMSAAAACETAGRGEMAAAGLRRGGGRAGVAAPCVYIWERETGVGGGWFWDQNQFFRALKSCVE